jgi:hypothetical protein
VAIADAALAAGAVEPDFSLGPDARTWFGELGVDLEALPRGRRPLLRVCTDWTGRREHLAGALGAAICSAVLGAGWAVRQPSSRALRVTSRGEAELGRLGIALTDTSLARWSADSADPLAEARRAQHRAAPAVQVSRASRR